MSDIIQLLPDNIANQIAAGEVIQRPASAVKELLENGVDAGADEIKLIIQEAGKTLIQVIDNGSGMSDSDARMAFERHATSKIKSIDDLFHIRTMGFRGEALASIAAVAQVELKTKRDADEAGTLIEIENSIVKRQEPVAHPRGSSIAMKNLFFNIPARRNFLKSNAAELRHILDEFIRVAMAFPNIFFSLVSNGQEVFHLEKGNLKQRVIQILGNNYASKLVSVQENTDYLNVHGFVGKPETAKKTRGDQYFFVNNRFIKSAYLNHAVMRAFEQLIPTDSFPMYALFIDLDPAVLDINVHPTKQEIKFEDEKIVYAFVQSAVKHALAQFSIAPSLDFELDPSIQHLDAVSKPQTADTINAASTSSLFKTFTQQNQAHLIDKNSDLKHWRDFFEAPDNDLVQKDIQIKSQIHSHGIDEKAYDENGLVQLQNTYILVPVSGGFRLVQQQNAHERILFDSYQAAELSGNNIAAQQSMFPVTVDFTSADAVIINELLPELLTLGYQIEPFGNNTFVIQGVPASVKEGSEKAILEKMLDQYKHFSSDIKCSAREKVWRSLASQQSIKSGTKLGIVEMQELISKLFSSPTPNATPSGRPVYLSFHYDELSSLFGR